MLKCLSSLLSCRYFHQEMMKKKPSSRLAWHPWFGSGNILQNILAPDRTAGSIGKRSNQSHVNDDAGILRPLGPSAVKSRCSFYADDVILFMEPVVEEVEAIKSLLLLFGDSAGLKINLAKCSVSPLSGRETDLAGVVCSLGCKIVELPVTYLGLSLHSGPSPRTKYKDSWTRWRPDCQRGEDR
jgi:hypothetical protein